MLPFYLPEIQIFLKKKMQKNFLYQIKLVYLQVKNKKKIN